MNKLENFENLRVSYLKKGFQKITRTTYRNFCVRLCSLAACVHVPPDPGARAEAGIRDMRAGRSTEALGARARGACAVAHCRTTDV